MKSMDEENVAATALSGRRLAGRSKAAAHAGFSLLELLVSVVIITVFMGAVFEFMGQAQKRYQGNQVISESNQTARAALEVMTQEIGQAGYNSSPNPNTSLPPENTYQLPYANGILYQSTGGQSNDHTLEFYGDINNDGNQNYVVYSLYAPANALTVTINNVQYTLYTLYRSITPVTATTNNLAYPMVQNVLYNMSNQSGPSGQPIFAFPQQALLLLAPSNITVAGTVNINLCVAVNPENLETGTVQWYTMATQVRPVNLAAAVAINQNAGGGKYLPAPPPNLPLANPSSYYQ